MRVNVCVHGCIYSCVQLKGALLGRWKGIILSTQARLTCVKETFLCLAELIHHSQNHHYLCVRLRNVKILIENDLHKSNTNYLVKV